MLVAKLIDRKTGENIIGIKTESLQQLKEKITTHFFHPENMLIMVEGMNPFLFTDFDLVLMPETEENYEVTEVSKIDINKTFTFEELKEAMNKLKLKKEIYVNQQTQHVITEKLGFEPVNLKVNNYIPVNQVIIFDVEEMEKNMFKAFGVPKEYLNS